MRVLILKPSSLGDVIQAIPVLRMLRRGLPASRIYWWIDVELSPLLEADADLAGLIPFHRRRWVWPHFWPEAVRSVHDIRALAFDVVLDLQALARSSVLAWLAGAKVTVGLDDPREGAVAFYDLRVPRSSYYQHAVDWYLATLEPLGVPINWEFEWLPERPTVARSIRAKWPVAGAPWVVLLPGARWPTKQWPVEHYAELTRRLVAAVPDARFAILGGAADMALGGAIAAAAPGRCLDLTGRTSLPEMVEWLRSSRLVVTNDTGPMHVAAALKKPLIALFGPTEPRRTGPYGQLNDTLQARLPCVPCLRSRCALSDPMACLRAIGPAEVCERALKMLAASEGSRPVAAK